MNQHNTKLNNVTYKWFGALLITALFGYFLMCHTCFNVDNIIKIEFSKSLDELIGYLKKIDLSLLKRNTALDFPFLLSYSLLFYYSIRVFEESIKLKFPLWILIFPFIPGVFDILENISLLGIIQNNDSEGLFNLFHCASRIKWGLALIMSMVLVAIFIFYFFKWIGIGINGILRLIKKIKKD